jgi:hypothetical protein
VECCSREETTQKDTIVPKNKKPAGGRPAKNFEPRRGETKTSFHDRNRGGSADARGQKPGSRSAGHRGFRAAEPDAAEVAPKRRWSAQEKAGRDEARGIRTHATGGARRTERPARSFDERPARRPVGSDRPARREYSNDRPARSFDDRPRRSYD